MANVIDLLLFRKLSKYSDFETRGGKVLALMESICGPVPNNPDSFEPSIINENWPVSKTFPMLVLL